MYIVFSVSSYTQFFSVLTVMLVLYLFAFDIRKIIKIEGKIDKKFKEEESFSLHRQNKNSAKIINNPNEDEIKLSKGNFVRISSVFNADKNEVCELLNDFSAYALVDENVKKAEADNYYNLINSNDANAANNQVKTQYYSVVYKDKEHCYGKKGRMANKHQTRKFF